MKKAIASIILGLAASSAAAQYIPIGSPGFVVVSSDPSGPCTPQAGQFVWSDGTAWSCVSLTWTQVGGVAGGTAFSTLTSGTNTTAAMVVGTGASLAVSGSGTIAATTAANLSGTPALPNGTTATTQAATDNTTKLATTQQVQSALAVVQTAQTTTPPWLQFLGYGTLPTTCTSGTCVQSGDLFVTTYNVSAGATVTVSNSSVGLTVHATGACTVNGTIDARGVTLPGVTTGIGASGSGGGGGGGTAAGAAGGIISGPVGTGSLGGTAGASSGGTGGNGIAQAGTTSNAHRTLSQGYFYDGQSMNGSTGGTGGSSGGAGGNGGGSVALICASITGTGTVDVSGNNGGPATNNSIGGGGGGGGGTIFLSSQAAETYTINTYAAGGPGSLAGTVGYPEALVLSGTATSPAKALLGVTTGALNGTCTVEQAGAGYGTGTGATVVVLGGGGTLGTGVVNLTWSAGALASCTVTPGTSSGYTAQTFTTSGAGGDGGAGQVYTFSGW